MTSLMANYLKKLNNGPYLFDVINTFAYKESFIIKIGCTKLMTEWLYFITLSQIQDQNFNGDSWLYSNQSCLQSWIIMIQFVY